MLLTFGAIRLTISEMSTTPGRCFFPLFPEAEKHHAGQTQLDLFHQQSREKMNT